MNKKRKKASYGKMNKMRGGDYMEPNKELKFGGPSHRVKAKKGRRKAGKGDTVEEEKSFLERASENWSKMVENMRNYGENSTYGQSDEAKARKANVKANKAESNAAAGAGAAHRRQMQEEITRNSPNPPASAGGQGTPVGSKAAKEVPYSNAKQRNANLDSLVKERNRLRDSGKKNSGEYNAVQNKINKAYGKGPTDRPTSSGKTNVASLNTRGTSTEALKKTQIENKYAPKQTLKTNMVSTSKPAAKPAAEPTGRAKKIADKAKEKVKKIEDRRASAKNRKEGRGRKDTARQAAKDSGATRGQVRAAGKMAKAGVKGKDKKFDRQYEKFGKRAKTEKPEKPTKPSRSERRAPIKKARAEKRAEIRTARGKQPRERALIGKTILKKGLDLAANIAPEGSFVNKAATTGQALMENPLKAAGNLIKGQPIAGGGQQQGAAGAAAPAAPGAPAAAPQPAATGQPAQQQTMQHGGKKHKGKKRKKAKFGMLSVKAGIDNNPNPTRADAIAGAKKGKKMTDRRSKARYGKKK